MPSPSPALKTLVERQTQLLNANAPEQERIAIYNRIVEKQEELRKERR
jgi:hypothetical protein